MVIKLTCSTDTDSLMNKLKLKILTKTSTEMNHVTCLQKFFTFITEDNHESRKVKGINKNVADDELKYEDYKNVLLNKLYET